MLDADIMAQSARRPPPRARRNPRLDGSRRVPATTGEVPRGEAGPVPGSASEWLFWQLADSAFPAGGFAHSGGLEAAWQQGEVTSRQLLAEFIKVNLTQVGHGALPFINEVFHNPERLPELDAICDAFLTNHVANRASRAQGQAFLVAAERSFASPALTRLREGAHMEGRTGHLPPVFGAVLSALNLPRESGLRLFLFMALRASIAGAVRLGIVGPLEAQGIQFRLTPHADEVLARCRDLPVSEATQVAPILDILHGAHDRLYSRLFQS